MVKGRISVGPILTKAKQKVTFAINQDSGDDNFRGMTEQPMYGYTWHSQLFI